MKCILFILNFRNLNLNEFDLTKILKKVLFIWAETGTGFIHEFNIICLFLIYIVYYYESKLLLQSYGEPKIMGIFMDIRDVIWGSISEN
jgi:hypothetical protein